MGSVEVVGAARVAAETLRKFQRHRTRIFLRNQR
jgi:hypothetical protein